MCIPKCARPDGPKCYKNPRKPKPDTSILLGPQFIEDIPSSISECGQYVESPETLQEIVDCVNATDKQVLARREKSRIAAKLRRQKENQALVKLRLTLPIHSCKALSEKCFQKLDASSCTSPVASSTQVNDELCNCALRAALSYRTASCFARQRQHKQQAQVTAPEFEKAVTVRLAGNALCLYNRLYPFLLSESTCYNSSRCSSPDVDCIITPDRTHNQRELLDPVSLTVLSQSLVAIIVDTLENTVVYASPSYCRILGLAWSTTIGLQLPELHFRQTSALTSVSSPHIGGSNAKGYFSQSTTSSADSRDPSPSSLSLDKAASCVRRSYDFNTTAPVGSVPGCPLWKHRSLDYTDRSMMGDLWPVSSSNRSGLLSSLLPPATAWLSCPEDPIASERDPSCSDSSAAHESNWHAVCWASYFLPPTLLDPPRSASGHTTDSSSASRLRVYLFNPIHPGCLDLANQPSSAAELDPVGLAGLPDPPGGAYTDLASSPRSFHLVQDWRFADAHPKFLTALNWTWSKLSDSSLLDLVHLDDLEHVADTLGDAGYNQPVVTGLYRLRSAEGSYRWCRTLAFHIDQPDRTTWHESSTAVATTPAAMDQKRHPESKNLHHHIHWRNRPGTDSSLSNRPSTLFGHCADTAIQSKSAVFDRNATSASVCNDSQPSCRVRLLVCCHQFVHYSSEPSSVSICRLDQWQSIATNTSGFIHQTVHDSNSSWPSQLKAEATGCSPLNARPSAPHLSSSVIANATIGHVQPNAVGDGHCTTSLERPNSGSFWLTCLEDPAVSDPPDRDFAFDYNHIKQEDYPYRTPPGETDTSSRNQVEPPPPYIDRPKLYLTSQQVQQPCSASNYGTPPTGLTPFTSSQHMYGDCPVETQAGWNENSGFLDNLLQDSRSECIGGLSYHYSEKGNSSIDPDWVNSGARCTSTDTGISLHMSASDLSDTQSLPHTEEAELLSSCPSRESHFHPSPGFGASHPQVCFSPATHSPKYWLPQAEVVHIRNWTGCVHGSASPKDWMMGQNTQTAPPGIWNSVHNVHTNDDYADGMETPNTIYLPNRWYSDSAQLCSTACFSPDDNHGSHSPFVSRHHQFTNTKPHFPSGFCQLRTTC